MRKLLIIYERNMPTVSLTIKGCKSNEDFGYYKVYDKRLVDVNPKDIDNTDCIIFVRPDNHYSAKIAKYARKAGATTITLCDDDLLNLNSLDFPNIPWRNKGLIKTMNHSDVLESASKYILEKYRKYVGGNRLYQINTAVNEEDFSEIHRTKDLVKIVYAASPHHIGFYNRFVKEAFIKIANEYKKNISITFIGVRPDLKELESVTNVEYIKGMPLEEYRKFMAKESFDIGLAPLNSDNFCKCKYFNKYIEYTISGVVGLYSNTEPYTYVIKNGKNGFLVDEEDWYKAIKNAIDNRGVIDKCIKNAREHVISNFNREKLIEIEKKELPELYNEIGKREKCRDFSFWKFTYYISRLFDIVYIVLFYIKNKQIRLLIEKIKLHFREKYATK